MTLQLTTDQVWQEIEREVFAVLGMVTARQEARTVGVVYGVHDRKLYIGTGKQRWKARHVAANPHVSLTIPIAKRIPIMPWVKIPAATITFAGEARVIAGENASPDLLKAMFRQQSFDPAFVASMCLIEVTPVGEFVTYGVGVSLSQMRYPEKARGRAAVGAATTSPAATTAPPTGGAQ